MLCLVLVNFKIWLTLKFLKLAQCARKWANAVKINSQFSIFSEELKKRRFDVSIDVAI